MRQQPSPMPMLQNTGSSSSLLSRSSSKATPPEAAAPAAAFSHATAYRLLQQPAATFSHVGTCGGGAGTPMPAVQPAIAWPPPAPAGPRRMHLCQQLSNCQ
eukprot:808654-Lingulodinium_polyedra.AAC.1